MTKSYKFPQNIFSLNCNICIMMRYETQIVKVN